MGFAALEPAFAAIATAPVECERTLLWFSEIARERFGAFHLTSREQNLLVMALLGKAAPDAAVRGLARAENPILKELNDRVLGDPALVDAIENWWRSVFNEELESPDFAALRRHILRRPGHDTLAIYASYKEVIVLFDSESGWMRGQWHSLLDRVATRFAGELQELIAESPEVAEIFAHERDLVRDPRRYHPSSFVGRGPTMLALATALGREARGAGPDAHGAPAPLTNNRRNVRVLERRFAEVRASHRDLLTALGADSPLLTEKGALTNDVNAVLRKVPTMNFDSYLDFVEEALQGRYGGRGSLTAGPGSERELLTHFYRAADAERPAAWQAFAGRLRERLGRDAPGIVDAIPKDGAALRRYYVTRRLGERRLGTGVTDAHVTAMLRFFDAVQRFDPPFLSADRTLLDVARAADAHFGFDVGEQGAVNARALQEHILAARDLTRALANAGDSEQEATRNLLDLMAIYREAAHDVGLLGAPGGSFRSTGDDASLAPPPAVKLDRAEGRRLRDRFYRRIAERAEDLGRDEPRLHRLRSVFNTQGGDAQLVTLGAGLEKAVRADLAKTYPWETLKKVLLVVELYPADEGNRTRGGTVDITVTAGYGFVPDAAFLRAVREAVRANFPVRWNVGEIRNNEAASTRPTGRVVLPFPLPTYAMARRMNPPASFG